MQLRIFVVLCLSTTLSLSIGSTVQTTDVKNMDNIVKRKDILGDYVMADYLFKLGDVNKDKYLDKNEIYNFYRHFIKFSFDQAAKMSFKLMNLGDINKDDKLDEIEAIIALSKVTNRITRQDK